MKKGGTRHPKTIALASLLGVPRLHAVGILEELWAWACDYAPQGDVGKWPDSVLATAVEWTGDPEQFVAALVQSGWADESKRYRIVLHDWPKHCPSWLQGLLSRKDLDFAVIDPKTDKSDSVSDSVADSVGTWDLGSGNSGTGVRNPESGRAPAPAREGIAQIETEQAPDSKSNGKARKTRGKIEKRGGSGDTYPVDFEEFWAAYPKREGGNPKRGAFQKWDRLVRNGATREQLVRAASNYARERMGEEPRFTKQAVTFLGPSGAWEEYADPSWVPPASTSSIPNRVTIEHIRREPFPDQARKDLAIWKARTPWRGRQEAKRALAIWLESLGLNESRRLEICLNYLGFREEARRNG